MPGLEAANAGFTADPMGHVCALSSKGPKMMFNAELAVSGGHLPARALVDTGATHCYVSEAFLAKTKLQVREQDTWLSLANGMKAISKGKAVLPVDIQSYQGAVECFTIPMSDHFDLIPVKIGVRQPTVKSLTRHTSCHVMILLVVVTSCLRKPQT